MALLPRTETRQYGGRELATPPAVEPVTAAELQNYLKTDSTLLPDVEALDLITQARQYIEQITGIAFITQGWKYFLDNWPVSSEAWWNGMRQGARTELYGNNNATIYLPTYPLQSLDAILTYDSAGAATAVSVGTTFDVDRAQKPGRFRLRSGASWPVATRSLNAIEIQYTAGFGDTGADVPAILKRGILAMAAALYKFRGDGCTLEDIYATSGASALINTYATGASV